MRAPAASVLLGVVALGGWTLAAQPRAPQASFTAAQAEAGRAAYEARCSGCHLPDLKGSFEAPQLAGANFVNQRGDMPVADLHAYLMASMPPTDPGSPGPQAMVDIIAYLLQANGARAGAQPLVPQATATLRSIIAVASSA